MQSPAGYAGAAVVVHYSKSEAEANEFLAYARMSASLGLTISVVGGLVLINARRWGAAD